MEIQEIKQRLTLAIVLQYYNLKPDKNQRLNCPFHEDKTPSMQVYYKTHTVYCFSSKCPTHGKAMDTIEIVQRMEKTDKHNALLKCKELISGTIPTIHPIHSTTSIKPTMSKEQTGGSQTPIKKQLTREQFLQKIFTYFKNAVHNSPPAKQYIQSRNLDHLKTEIGYNSGQFHHGARKDEQLIKQCLQYGLLTASGVSRTREQTYTVFGKCCIVFSLRNKGNEITGLYFRSTINEKESKHFYLKESTGLYPKYPNPETEKLIIAESIIDTASLLQIENITKHYSLLSAYGTNRLNDEMKTAISELKQLKEIVFAFDNDEAGNKAVEKYAEELKAIVPGIKCSKIELPCKDVNETLSAHQPEIFLHLLENKTFLFSTEKEKIQPSEIAENTDTLEHHQIIKSSNQLIVTNPYKLTFTTQTVLYHIKGGVDKIMNKLNVTLEICKSLPLGEVGGASKRRFKLDLYDNKQVEKVIQEASEQLQITNEKLKTDMENLTEQLDNHREKEMQSTNEEQAEPSVYQLTTQEKNEVLQIANDKNLIKTIQEKLTQTGIIGEEKNKTFLFVVGASHIQENPLNALIQGSSGSGKTNLLKGIFRIMPEESKKIYSRCSEKMLYNVPKYYFKNKLICFEDVDGLGEEAEYAWRELVSNGELISGVSYKDEKGNIGIKELTVYGPITSIACTTKGAIYADNMSRLFLIAIDESKEQTQKINEYQAKEAAGIINKQEQKNNITQLQNFVRILQPYQVHNPHATKLKLPEGIRDERRLYRLYLYFIDMITVLHQYQRKKNPQGKLIATKQDCQIAKDLMFECIMLKMDELDGSLRQFFERLKEFIKTKNNDKYSFTQREIRESLKVSKTHLFRFMTELTFLEYTQENKYNGNQGNTYQIRYWDDYKKVREEVKQFLQNQIDQLAD